MPAVLAAAAGLADSPICFSDRKGAPGRRRTKPPSWSVISSSGACTGLLGLASAASSVLITLAICGSLEMLSPKKMTPAASPSLICESRLAGGVSPV